MRGGHRDGPAEAQRMEVGGRGIGCETLGLVDDDQHRLAGSPQHIRHVPVRRREAGAAVHDEQYPVGLLDRLARLGGGELFEAVRAFDQATGVDHDRRVCTDARVTILAVTRQPRHVGDERVARAREHVEQRRLADVGTSDERQDGKHRPCLTPRRRPRRRCCGKPPACRRRRA